MFSSYFWGVQLLIKNPSGFFQAWHGKLQRLSLRGSWWEAWCTASALQCLEKILVKDLALTGESWSLHICILSLRTFIPRSLSEALGTSLFKVPLLRSPYRRKERENLKTLYLPDSAPGTFPLIVLFFLPLTPRSINLLKSFVRGSLNSKKIPLSALIHLAHDWCAISGGKWNEGDSVFSPILASWLFYHDK